MPASKFIIAVGAALTVTSAALAAPSTTTASQDTFLYSSSSLASTPFGGAPYIGVSRDRDNARTVWSLIQFNPAGVTLGAGEGASISVYSKTAAGTPFNGVTVQPSAATPTIVDAYRVTQAWNENTASWNNRPTVDESAPVASFTINDVNKAFSFNATSLLQGWLANPATNFGLELRQRDVISVGQFDVAVVLGGAPGSNPAALVVPEPTTLAALGGALTLIARRRR